jgi:hypothetical protein
MEEPTTPEPQLPGDVKEQKEPFTEKFKAFGKWWFVGTASLVSFSFLGVFGNAIGVQQLNLRTIGSPTDIVFIFSQLNWQTALFVLFSAAAVGGISLFWVASSSAYGKLFRLHKDAIITDKELDKEISSQLRKLKILPAIVWGIFVGIMVLAVAGGIYTLTGVTITNAHSLMNAYVGGHYLVTIITIIGGAIVGWLMNHFKNEYNKAFEKIQKKMPKGFDKIL